LDNSSTIIRKMYIGSMRFLVNHCSTQLLACSNGSGRYLFGEKALSNTKYAYFPNAIDYSKFLKTPSTGVKKFKMEEGIAKSFVIGHIGRFIEGKNHNFLLEILKCLVKKNASIKMILVVDGELRKLIEKRAQREGIDKNIRF